MLAHGQLAKVSVFRQHNQIVRGGKSQDFSIRLASSHILAANNIMPIKDQTLANIARNVLVKQQSHDGVAALPMSLAAYAMAAITCSRDCWG